MITCTSVSFITVSKTSGRMKGCLESTMESLFMAGKISFSGYLVIFIKITVPNRPGPVVQSIVSLTSLLRVQLVKCTTALQPNTLKFFVEKIEKLCSAKASHIFSTKNIGVFQILTFEILTKH